MSNIAIHIEGLTKEYRLGVISHRTLYRDVQSRLSRLMNREDPNSLVGIDPQRTRGGKFHALDNITLEVLQGDVVGIIGKNGAGKSTLLKILSRVTGPTFGEVKIRGRIASLLEVGTGFHPELTGRENVYLNGAILGMRKKEVAVKFDEITSFSGIEEFIDTPVKRYSSGMYVRLAFAVAAHLEPEILIVDEVLAVGDAEFRKKCITKMGEVSKTGRTILFVSHEMSAITSLCNKGVLMDNGRIAAQGQIESVVSQYSFKIAKQSTEKSWNADESPGDEMVRLRSVRLINREYESIQSVNFSKEFAVEMVYEILQEGSRINPGVTMYSSGGQVLLVSFPQSEEIKTSRGVYKAYCWFPARFLNADIFSMRINAHTFYPTKVHFDIMDAVQFEVIEYDVQERKIDYMDKLFGFTRLNLEWTFK